MRTKHRHWVWAGFEMVRVSRISDREAVYSMVSVWAGSLHGALRGPGFGSSGRCLSGVFICFCASPVPHAQLCLMAVFHKFCTI